MRTVIIYSTCGFPLSAVAGCILTGKLTVRYCPGTVRKALEGAGPPGYSEGRAIFLGETPGGDRVAAFTARSGRVILKNMIRSFLEANQVGSDRHLLLEVSAPASLRLLLGQVMLCLPLAGGAGISLLEKYIEKIYPRLVEAVKLDCNCQISDN